MASPDVAPSPYGDSTAVPAPAYDTGGVNYLALCYGLAVPLVVAMAIYAMVVGYMKRTKISDNESFITARRQVGVFLIGWSFYASAVGAWVMASPASYASTAGMLGLVMYALSSGLPFIMIAFAGDIIRTRVPHVLSLTDYMGWRFGFASKTVVFIVILFNMSIALLAEYLTIGSIFKYYVGSVSYAMIIITGLLTTMYTAYGGLLVSIYTDRLQAIASVLLFLVLAIYLAVTFRPDLPTPMPCDPSPWSDVANVTNVAYNLGPPAFCVSGTPNCGTFEVYNFAVESVNATAQDPTLATATCPTWGYSSILTMPLSLFAATIFSEAMWQRAWAAYDRRALHLGAIVGAVGVVLMVFFAGLCGLLAAWGGLITPDTNYNVYLFQVLGGGQIPPSQTVYNWIGAFCVVLAAVMNEGAVDSLQNGMASAITSYISTMYTRFDLKYTRVTVLVINVALILIAIWLTGSFGSAPQINVLQLFLIANLLATCGAAPVLAGLSESLYAYFGGISFLFSFIFPMLCLSIYGVNFYYSSSNIDYVNYALTMGGFDVSMYGRDPSIQPTFNNAMFFTWIGNNYSWQFFLVPFCVSLGCILLSVAVNGLIKHVLKMQLPTVPGLTNSSQPLTFPETGHPVAQGDAGIYVKPTATVDATDNGHKGSFKNGNGSDDSPRPSGSEVETA